MHQIVCSLYGYEQPGRQQLSFVVQPTWELETAIASLSSGGVDYSSPRTTTSPQGQTLLQFASSDHRLSRGENESGELLLDLHYEDGKPIRLHFKQMTWTPEMQSHFEQIARRDAERNVSPESGFPKSPRELFKILPATQTQTVARPPRTSYVITNVEIGGSELALLDSASLSSSKYDSERPSNSLSPDEGEPTEETPTRRERPNAPTPKGITLLRQPVEITPPPAK